MSELLKLAEQAEGCLGPDRELDRAIELAVMPERLDPTPTVELLAYTASLDAALTLVPEGYGFTLALTLSNGAVGRVFGQTFDVSAHAATTALALTAAALRALAADEGGER